MTANKEVSSDSFSSASDTIPSDVMGQKDVLCSFLHCFLIVGLFLPILSSFILARNDDTTADLMGMDSLLLFLLFPEFKF